MSFGEGNLRTAVRDLQGEITRLESRCAELEALVCGMVDELEYREKGCIRCHSTYWRMKAQDLGIEVNDAEHR